MAIPYIIAEIASAHEGDRALALRQLELAASTGADAVKFQIFQRDSLISRYHEKFSSFGQIELHPDAWREILKTSSRTGLDTLVEVYDDASLELAESTGVVAAYKLPTSDIGNLDFLLRTASIGKKLFLAVGGATDVEIRRAVEAIASRVAPGNLVLMHGFQSYPTRLEDTNLERLTWLRREFGLPVGYADHIDAEDREMARALPAMSLAGGATFIEKHITDDRSRKGRDHYSSLNPDEFRDFVAFMRRAAPAVGSADPALTEAEVAYRYAMKKQAVVSRDMQAGAMITADAVGYKRTGRDGLDPQRIAALIGRKLKVAKIQDEPITLDDLS